MHKEIKPTRIACFFVAIIMISATLFSAIPTYANTESDYDNQESIAVYSNAATSTCSISVSGITATCTVRVKSPKSQLAKVTMEMQKKKSSGYKTVETWSSSKSRHKSVFFRKKEHKHPLHIQIKGNNNRRR